MHLHAIIAYCMLIWWLQDRPVEPWLTNPSAMWAVVIGQMLLVAVLATLASRSAVKVFDGSPDGPDEAQHLYHRNNFILRTFVLLTFAACLALTPWVDWVANIEPLSMIPGLAGLITLVPFLLTATIAIACSFPIDRKIRFWVAGTQAWRTGSAPQVWDFKSYLGFNVRHQLLAVVAPTTIILAAFDVTTTYEEEIQNVIPIQWAPDAILGLTAAGVFVLAPWMLRHIWTTHSLPDGPLRQQLQDACERIGMKCRDILVWRSGGMIVNAAVMGIFAPIRYVMLSDGLLNALSHKQIEAVFGHEASHVKHRHIQHFLVFAMTSMLVSGAIMEAVYQWQLNFPDVLPFDFTIASIQGVGLVAIALIWGIGFGFVSRRFERQADLFGARCVSPSKDDECDQPCGLHPPSHIGEYDTSPLCTSGSKTFSSALEAVAILNGIPIEERSWRHSSIASRIRHLDSLAADRNQLNHFESVIRRIKRTQLAIAIVGVLISGVYGLYIYADREKPDPAGRDNSIALVRCSASLTGD